MPDTQSIHYVGIDPSLTSSGLVIIGQNSILPLCITPKTLRGTERLAYIRDEVQDALPRENTFACIEGPAMHAIGRADDLGQLRGVLLLLLYDLKIPTTIIPPTVLKKFATRHGNAKKEQVIEAALLKWGIVLNDDEADAAWLAAIAQALQDNSIVLTRPQLEVINGIRNPKRPKSILTFRRTNGI